VVQPKRERIRPPMTIPVFHLSPVGCWDQHLLADLLADCGDTPWSGGEHHDLVNIEVESIADLPGEQGAIWVVPGAYWKDRVDEINAAINRRPWALVFLVSDEASLFPVEELSHPEMRLWVMTPRARHTKVTDRFLGEGFATDTRDVLRPLGPERKVDRDWFFAGQVTHVRRQQAATALRSMPRGLLLETAGFLQGMTREVYLEEMAAAKVSPCPSGPDTPDSFRLYEALEMGVLPIADATCPAGGHGYWHQLCGGAPPFPVIDHWKDLPEVMAKAVAGWPGNANRAFAWWQQYKRNLHHRIQRDISGLARATPTRSFGQDVTVLIPTSPIPSHPSTAIIEETIESVLAQQELAGCEIIVMVDGVRPEQEHRRADFEEYTRRLLWLCNYRWSNVVPIVFERHGHQANLTRAALQATHTHLVLFVEHDTPLVTDEPIPWEQIGQSVKWGALDVVRFHYEAFIPEPHLHLMLDDGPLDFYGIPMRRTTQWSQRPHLANASYYRKIIQANFPTTSRTMIEDKMHGVAQSEGWRKHRIAIFHPEGNIKRSLNLDGRQDDPMYPMDFGR
jgi:hypothetical protein